MLSIDIWRLWAKSKEVIINKISPSIYISKWISDKSKTLNLVFLFNRWRVFWILGRKEERRIPDLPQTFSHSRIPCPRLRIQAAQQVFLAFSIFPQFKRSYVSVAWMTCEVVWIGFFLSLFSDWLNNWGSLFYNC